LRSAVAIISMPTAIRSCSRCTAASILRILAEHQFDDVVGSQLVDTEVAGLMASVGSDCHFDARP
jgi:hypothetical protein